MSSPARLLDSRFDSEAMFHAAVLHHARRKVQCAGTWPAAGPISSRLSADAQDVLARISGIVPVALPLRWLVEGPEQFAGTTRPGAAILGHFTP